MYTSFYTCSKISFLHDELWPHPYDHLYVSLRSGGSVGNDLAVDADAEPALQLDTEPAVKQKELEPLPSDKVVTEDSHQPPARLDEAGNEIRDQSTDSDHLPEVDMHRPVRVTFDKEVPYAPSLMELIRCRRRRDSTLQPVGIP